VLFEERRIETNRHEKLLITKVKMWFRYALRKKASRAAITAADSPRLAPLRWRYAANSIGP
jgi:hypothetical protein